MSDSGRIQLAVHPEMLNHSGSCLKCWHGWVPLAVLPGIVFALVPAAWPRWAFMWTLAFAIYCGCKWLTWRRTPIEGVTLWRRLGYLAAWPGLDAASFLNPSPDRAVLPPRLWEWLFATGKLIVGIGMLYGVARLVPAQHPYLVGWIGMIGVVMVLHFGVFHLLSCAWRRAGVDARPLMHWPLASVSVSEFWGRRWNTAFRDLTHRFLFRPLNSRLGPRGAVFGGFVFSGLVHDFVISVPAGGGYGGPSLFFLLQGVAILAVRSRGGKRMGLGTGWRGWLFTMAVLLAPVSLLFHRPFITAVVVPSMQAARAI